jgi:hypothetical protein
VLLHRRQVVLSQVLIMNNLAPAVWFFHLAAMPRHSIADFVNQRNFEENYP